MRRGRISDVPRAGAGFTLLEMVVSTLLVALIMLFAVQLTRQAQLVFLSVQRAQQPGTARTALNLLRNDVHRASSAGVSILSNELVLRYPDGSSIHYSVELEQLERRLRSPSDNDSNPRVLARGVSTWRWEMLHPTLVEIHLEMTGDGPIRVPGATSHAPWRRMSPKAGSYHLRLALRGTPGRRSW